MPKNYWVVATFVGVLAATIVTHNFGGRSLVGQTLAIVGIVAASWGAAFTLSRRRDTRRRDAI